MKASEDKSDHSRRKSCDQLAMSSKNEEKGGKVIYTILSPSLLYLATYWLICCFICITKMSFFFISPSFSSCFEFHFGDSQRLWLTSFWCAQDQKSLPLNARQYFKGLLLVMLFKVVSTQKLSVILKEG